MTTRWRAIRAYTALGWMLGCAVIWSDRFPLSQVAPGRQIETEIKVSSCEASGVWVEGRTLDDGQAVGDGWKRLNAVPPDPDNAGTTPPVRVIQTPPPPVPASEPPESGVSD